MISGIIKVIRGKCYQPEPSRRAWLIRPSLFRISLKQNLIIVLLYNVFKKIRTNIASHGTQFDIFKLILKIMHYVQPTDYDFRNLL